MDDEPLFTWTEALLIAAVGILALLAALVPVG
jgi:hypothetical protein